MSSILLATANMSQPQFRGEPTRPKTHTRKHSGDSAKSKSQVKGTSVSVTRGGWVRPLASPNSSTLSSRNVSTSNLVARKGAAPAQPKKRRRARSAGDVSNRVPLPTTQIKAAVSTTHLPGNHQPRHQASEVPKTKTKHKRRKRKAQPELLPPIPALPPLSPFPTPTDEIPPPYLSHPTSPTLASPQRTTPSPPTRIAPSPPRASQPQPQHHNQQDRTSIYTFLTDSTKIGEITNDRWVRIRDENQRYAHGYGVVGEDGVFRLRDEGGRYGAGAAGDKWLDEEAVRAYNGTTTGNGKRGWKFWKRAA